MNSSQSVREYASSEMSKNASTIEEMKALDEKRKLAAEQLLFKLNKNDISRIDKAITRCNNETEDTTKKSGTQ